MPSSSRFSHPSLRPAGAPHQRAASCPLTARPRPDRLPPPTWEELLGRR